MLNYVLKAVKAAAVVCSSHLCDGGKCISEWVNGSLVEPSVWYNEKKQTLIETWELWKWVNRRVRKSIKKLEKTLGVRVIQPHSQMASHSVVQSQWVRLTTLSADYMTQDRVVTSPTIELQAALHILTYIKESSTMIKSTVCMCLSVTLRARDTNKIEEDKQCRKDGGKWTVV